MGFSTGQEVCVVGTVTNGTPSSDGYVRVVIPNLEYQSVYVYLNPDVLIPIEKSVGESVTKSISFADVRVGDRVRVTTVRELSDFSRAVTLVGLVSHVDSQSFDLGEHYRAWVDADFTTIELLDRAVEPTLSVGAKVKVGASKKLPVGSLIEDSTERYVVQSSGLLSVGDGIVYDWENWDHWEFVTIKYIADENGEQTNE